MIAILGAGSARRFGADKLSQPCAGKPLGRWALDAARATHWPVVWVAGESAPGFVDCEVALNPRAAEGIGTSAALAARIAQARGADCLLIMLADMPLVSPELLARLIAAGAPAACRHADGKIGVPALLPASAFALIAALGGDRGAGNVLAWMPGLTCIEAEPQCLFDVDTPQALAKAERLLGLRFTT